MQDLGKTTHVIMRYLEERISKLNPVYFAMIMATGIVSIACFFLGLKEFSGFLFRINVIAFVVIWVLTLARLIFFPTLFFRDLKDHQRGPCFFTCVAATNVFGTQLVLLTQNLAIAQILWWFGLVLWALCTYSIFVALSIKQEKPSLANGINGGWLVAVVATQSITILGCLLSQNLFIHHDFTLFFVTSFWLWGGMLYIWMITLIFYRYMFFRFEPSDLMPPYWINMGAVAISTLAGTMLARTIEGSSSLGTLLSFIKGMTLMYWATATWWIPILLFLGIWRHNVRHFRFEYEPLYWGLVFPLGMYSVCTFQLLKIFDFPNFFDVIAKIFAVFALIAWFLTFLGMAKDILYLILLTLGFHPIKWASHSDVSDKIKLRR